MVTDEFDYNLLFSYLNSKGTLVKATKLRGGITFDVELLEIVDREGEIIKLILRKSTGIDTTKYSKKLQKEYKLLKLLQKADTHAPTPLFIDTDKNFYLNPFIVLNYIEGQTQFKPTNIYDFIIKYTTNLIKIHHINIKENDFSFLPSQNEVLRIRLEQMYNNQIEDQIFTPLMTEPNKNDSVLLHGDYWPGNILWFKDELVATIDWEDAFIGDPLLDVANSRLELLWAFDRQTMNEFTTFYRQKNHQVDFGNLPIWDLLVAKQNAQSIDNWPIKKLKKEKMKKNLLWFEEQALRLLNGE